MLTFRLLKPQLQGLAQQWCLLDITNSLNTTLSEKVTVQTRISPAAELMYVVQPADDPSVPSVPSHRQTHPPSHCSVCSCYSDPHHTDRERDLLRVAALIWRARLEKHWPPPYLHKTSPFYCFTPLFSCIFWVAFHSTLGWTSAPHSKAFPETVPWSTVSCGISVVRAS